MIDASQSNTIIKALASRRLAGSTSRSNDRCCLQPAFMQQSTHLTRPPTLARSPPEKKNKRSLAVGEGHDGWPTGPEDWQHVDCPPCTGNVCLHI